MSQLDTLTELWEELLPLEPHDDDLALLVRIPELKNRVMTVLQQRIETEHALGDFLANFGPYRPQTDATLRFIERKPDKKKAAYEVRRDKIGAFQALQKLLQNATKNPTWLQILQKMFQERMRREKIMKVLASYIRP